MPYIQFNYLTLICGMKMISAVHFTVALILLALPCSAQLTLSKAHSHNDYLQTLPFYKAFSEGFGSIEVDVFLENGQLLVGHEKKELREDRTLASLYLDPLQSLVSEVKELQLLIDIKTEPYSTLAAIERELHSFPQLINHSGIRFVITGNRPKPEEYKNYPLFIWFDGRLNETYQPDQLKRIALISESMPGFLGTNEVWPLSLEQKQNIRELVQQVNKLKKPFRFWATPDLPASWDQLSGLGISYINTDKVEALADHILKQDTLVRQLPYSKEIRSAGRVVRFGSPVLENHALDIAALPDSNLVVVQERYGIYVLELSTGKIIDQLRLDKSQSYRSFMSTFSGIKVFQEQGRTFIVWGVAERGGKKSALLIAEWKQKLSWEKQIAFDPLPPAASAIPNEVVVNREKGSLYFYVVLNGNNELVKIEVATGNTVWKRPTGIAPYGVTLLDNKLFISNWAGPVVKDSSSYVTAPSPWQLAYTNPHNGSTALGSVSVYSTEGQWLNETKVGLHPNAIIADPKRNLVYVSNGSSDTISVIHGRELKVIDAFSVAPDQTGFFGSTPNALSLSKQGDILYVANGMDNCVVVVQVGEYEGTKSKKEAQVKGFVPTEAFPAGICETDQYLVVANLEAEGSNVVDEAKKARSIHHELASVSIIGKSVLDSLSYYSSVVSGNLHLRQLRMARLRPRSNVKPIPVPARIGEPSVFKHVVYIIKENKTYDQVFGDIPQSNADSTLCIFGENVAPNMHALAKRFGILDNFLASGKSSAEGHQWTDAGIVTDYIEKNVRAWFRSYPHRQEDAMVYSSTGFIWDHALSYGKKVRVFGEACETQYDRKKDWFALYAEYLAGVVPDWKNTTTIDNLAPYISSTFPDCDNMVFSDQQRADIFISEWNQLGRSGQLPDLMVLSLPNDHTAGTAPEFPTPNAMVADNDLALGRIIQAISTSKYWDSTVIFVTEDDSQGGWDHVSAYRTVGLVISPYSKGGVISSRYNQVSMLRTIEQILGIPPMNRVDAASRLMSDCFVGDIQNKEYTFLPNRVKLDERNKPLQALSGKARKFARLSASEVYSTVDSGEDEIMNRILWFYAKGRKAYPEKQSD